MDDCNKNKEEETCTTGLDRCATVTLSYGETKSYSKMCQANAICENSDQILSACKAVDGATCKLECCEGDNCNGGAAAAVSIILMTACALMAFFH